MSRLASIPTIQRRETRVPNINLNNTGTKVRIPVTAGQAVTVYGFLEFGTWATATMTIKQRSGGAHNAQAFASAKNFAAGGGVLRMSATEMAGVDELEAQVTLVEGADATAMLQVVAEVPVQAITVQDGGTDHGSVPGTPSSPASPLGPSGGVVIT